MLYLKRLLHFYYTTMRYHCADSCGLPVVFITGINPWTSGILRWIGGIFSEEYSIYTKYGKYGGGVYVVDGYSMDRMYMTDSEIYVLQKLYIAAEKNESLLSEDEKKLLGFLIAQYSKPKITNERNVQ